MLRILGIGNALVDVSVFVHDDSILEKHHLYKGGMTLIDEETEKVIEQEIRGMNPQMSTGGSTGNAMMALASLGTRPTFVGRIGNDELGRFFRDAGTRQGICEKLITCDEHTGVANTFISGYGERSFGTHLGAAMGLKADDITEELLGGCDLVHIEGYLVQNHELMEKICLTARKLGLKLSLDLGSWNIVEEGDESADVNGRQYGKCHDGSCKPGGQAYVCGADWQRRTGTFLQGCRHEAGNMRKTDYL